MLPTFAVFTLGCVALRSKQKLFRRLLPLGVDRSGDVTTARILTTDARVDLNDIRRHALFVRLTFTWASQFAIAFGAVAATIALLLPFNSADETMASAFFGSFLALIAVALWPKSKPPTSPALERNLNMLLPLFQCRCAGPLKTLQKSVKPFIAAKLRNAPLLDPDGPRDVEDLRRATERLELARAVTAWDVVAMWTPAAQSALREHVADGVVRLWSGAQPSPYWMAWAARLAAAIGEEAMARSLAECAANNLPARWDQVRGVVIASTAARLAGTEVTRKVMHSMTIRRLLRATDSLSDLAAFAPFVEGDALITLQHTARSRLWLELHAN